jgi:hypothetical protein
MRRQLPALLLLSTASLAQVAVEGDVVLKTTGAPLAGVRVAAGCPELQWAATDVAGHFRFPVLQASLPFCTLSLDGPRLLPRHQWIAIHPQDSHISTHVEMRPQAAIAGKVLDENGWPVEGASLTAAQYRTADGIRELQPVASVRTDDRGEYRFGKLVQGRYYIQARPPGDVPGGDYLPTAAEDASPIDLREGQEVTSADIHLARGGGVEVSGRVVLPDGFQPAQASLRVYWENLVTTNGRPSLPDRPGWDLHRAPPRARHICTDSQHRRTPEFFHAEVPGCADDEGLPREYRWHRAKRCRDTHPGTQGNRRVRRRGQAGSLVHHLEPAARAIQYQGGPGGTGRQLRHSRPLARPLQVERYGGGRPGDIDTVRRPGD